jgi:outer membrane receptor protein involved in Fe transport
MLRVLRRFRRIALAASFAGALAAGTSGIAAAATLTGTIAATDGTPIAGAVVTLGGNGKPVVLTSDKSGRFTANLSAGTFTVSATAKGYTALSGRTIELNDGSPNTIDLVLSRAQASALTVIGNVRANGHQTLSTSPGQSAEINASTYAQRGVTRTSDVLDNELSTTVQPVIGGGLNAPAVVSLRGPDPSETLVELDGHAVNNGATGDFDLSLLDPADLQSVQVIYGIGPSSLFGPNTLGGALNVRTLEPTAQTHVLERFTTGNYDTNGGTLQATGTADRLGYAISFHRVTSGGELADYVVPGTGGQTVGNPLDASSTVAKLRYSLFNGQGFVGLNLRDQSVFRDISAAQTAYDTTSSTYSSAAGSAMTANNAACGIDFQAPLGRPNHDGVSPTTAVFRYQTSFEKQAVTGPAAGSSPYLFDDRDLIGDATLEFDRAMPHGSLALKFATTTENLDTGLVTGKSFADTDSVGRRFAQDDDGGGGAVGLGGIALVTEESLAQTQRSVGFRYTDDPTPKLHYSFATYYSDYSTFGRSTDPRFGFVWTPTGETAVRFSAGTSFESPQLLSLVVPPPATLYTPVDGYVTVGNPNLNAERATEYDAGYEHLFKLQGKALHLGLDLFRTNLRDGIAVFQSTAPCAANAAPVAAIYAKAEGCLSYPVNVGTGVYEGIELHGDFQLAADTMLHASYGINSVYTESAPVADNIVPGQQNLGVPLHKFGLTIEHTAPAGGFGGYAGLLYEGNYNELNVAPYATLRAGLSYHSRNFDIGVNGTNLTNVNDFKFTRLSGGVLYGGLPATAASPNNGPIATSAIPLAGTQFILSITHHT